MQLDNQGPWQADLIPAWALNKDWQHTLVVKASYSFERDGQINAWGESAGLVYVDEYNGEPESSSVARAAEAVPFKRGFEILIQGRAEPPAGRLAQRLEAALLRNGQPWWQKQLTLFGKRHWQRGMLGFYPSYPETLTPMEVSWEYAFGGTSEKGEHRYDANPVGRGWAHKQGRHAKGRLLPQIEQEPLITLVTHRRKPAGFAPLAPHWEPRLSAFNTLDTDAATQGQCPYAGSTPATLYNCAPEDQQLQEPPRAGDSLLLKGWYADAPSLLVTLPKPEIEAYVVQSNGAIQRVEPAWDTLLVDATEQRLDLTFRLGIPDSKALNGARLVLRDASEPDDQIEEDASSIGGEAQPA